MKNEKCYNIKGADAIVEASLEKVDEEWYLKFNETRHPNIKYVVNTVIYVFDVIKAWQREKLVIDEWAEEKIRHICICISGYKIRVSGSTNRLELYELLGNQATF